MAPVEATSASLSRRVRAAPGKLRARTVVWVVSEQDMATRAELSDAIARTAARGGADLFVDLSAVTFMGASTIGAIVGGRNLPQSRSRLLSVRAPSGCARRLLDLCDLSSLLEPVKSPRPVGATAALATWVDVPPSDRPRSAQAVRPAMRPARAGRPPAVSGATAEIGATAAVETVGAGP